MATPITWALYDNSGAPLLGATPTFVDFCLRNGAVVTPAPTIIELGGGLYGFEPTSQHEQQGICYLINNGTGANPARIAGGIGIPSLPFSVWYLEDGAGALWTGAPPTIAAGNYRSMTSVLTAPPIVAARSYLFSLTPVQADADVGVTFLSNSPAGAFPESVQDNLKSVPLSSGVVNNIVTSTGGSSVAGPTGDGIPSAELELNAFVAQVRAFMRDYPELNRLIAGEESSNRQIVWAIFDALDDYNSTPPFSGNTLRTFPSKSLLVRGTVLSLLESIGLLQTRNQLSFSDGGLQVGVSDKTPYLQSWIQLFRNSFEEKKMRMKVAINIESAWGGGLSSEFRFVNNFYGEW